MNQPTGSEEARLLLTRGSPGGAADPYVDLFSAAMPDDVGFGGPLGNSDNRDSANSIDRNFLVERQYHRMHDATEHGIHHPLFEIVPPDPGDGAVVFDSEENAPPLEIGEGNHFPRELLRAQIIPLELHSGVLAAGQQFE